jgi:DNA-binding TFAR19-related protein (PDSD5 family)
VDEYESNEQEQSPNQQKRIQRELQRVLKNAQIEQQKKALVRHALDDNAYARLMNIRVSNRELYSQLVDMIISLSQSGRLGGKLTEAQFVDVLKRITARAEPEISFRHK